MEPTSCLTAVRTMLVLSDCQAHAPPTPRVVLPRETFGHISRRLAGFTVAGSGRLIVVHPGSSSSARRAPLASFTETLKQISAKESIAIVVIGGTLDESIAASLLQALPSTVHATNWAGQLSLVETGALLAQADLFIGNDSGPLKLAEAVGARTVSFWGPSAPRFAGPRGEHHRTVHFDDPPEAAALAALALLDHPSSP